MANMVPLSSFTEHLKELGNRDDDANGNVDFDPRLSTHNVKTDFVGTGKYILRMRAPWRISWN